MKWIEAKVFVESGVRSQAMEIVSDIFDELVTGGVAIEEPGEEPVEGWDAGASKPCGHYAVTGYFPENDRKENRIRLLEEMLSGLKAREGIETRVEYRAVDEEDWAHSWKKYFKPRKIGDRVVVKPTWCDYVPEPGDIVLEIDPGMAFGTGTHPTTANCVRLLERYFKKDCSFLDVGTGSGILMMTAASLGAGFLAGTDIDETAVDIAKRNLLRNGVERDRFHLAIANLAQGIKREFDVVAANILSEVVVRLLDDLPRVMSPNGLFIASGIVEENLEPVFAKIYERKLEVVEHVVEEKWGAIVAKKNQ